MSKVVRTTKLRRNGGGRHLARLGVLAAAVLVGVAVLLVDVRGAIGFSSTLVLCYYAVANAAALRLGPAERRWPRWLAWLGLAGCLVLAASLPPASVLAGAAVLAAGAAGWLARRRLG
jgi:APA family basic amino acid/polyamine antiporter